MKMQRTKDALAKYDEHMVRIERAYELMDSAKSITDAQDAEERITRLVQEAFAHDTADINPGLDPSLVDIPFARRTVQAYEDRLEEDRDHAAAELNGRTA